jgi:predicted nucleic acid-binding protein
LTFIDTNIPLYASGKEHPYREACRNLVRALAEGTLRGVTDTGVLQELMDVGLHSGRSLRVYDLWRIIMDGSILPVSVDDMDAARRLHARHPGLSPRELIHAAVMLNNGILTVISADQHFDEIEGISRLDPKNTGA